MNPLTEKQLEKMLKQAPTGGDLDRAVQGVLARAERDDQALEDLATYISPRVLEAPSRLDEERRELEEYFEGKRDHFDVPVDWALTPAGFRNRALHAVARIPYGETRTYAEIAKQAGNPRAFRAAGTACGRNAVPLIVPCHLVLQSSGGVGNYGGGPE